VWLAAAELIEAGPATGSWPGISGSRRCRRTVAAGACGGGRAALASKGPMKADASSPEPSLRELEADPAASGKMKTERAKRTVAGSPSWCATGSGWSYTLAGLDLLLHRIGCSVQVPARPAAESIRRVSPGGGR
jgi:hypothetical protein